MASKANDGKRNLVKTREDCSILFNKIQRKIKTAKWVMLFILYTVLCTESGRLRCNSKFSIVANKITARQTLFCHTYW